jgi:glycosyltransferase involved in cell wall biosynthesis
MAKVVIIGPAHPLRGGGIVSFNHRLAQAYGQAGHDCEIWSFSLQYPSFLFPGKSQYSNEPAPKGLRIHSAINSINPLNWIRIGKKIKSLRPDLVVVRFWLPLMGPALGTILSFIKKNGHSRIVCIADNIVPHEKRPGDKLFTRYFLHYCDSFVTMSNQVSQDLRSFEKNKPFQQISHPLYDHFGEAISMEAARKKLEIDLSDKLILFFGFIRKYKGLGLLLEALADERLEKQNIKLLIAGEYYENEQPYLDQIERLQLTERVYCHTHFIADRDVPNYLCAADVVVQPYRHATQSGVTPLAYHFERPMIVTHVGGLSDAVPDGKAGLVCEPNSRAIADTILRFYELGGSHFTEGIKEQKNKLSWQTLVQTTLQLAGLNENETA